MTFCDINAIQINADLDKALAAQQIVSLESESRLD